MLQRAASNAYSWWWASHIRTKQSKWLEHNLQDMEEKVRYTLEIIDEDGDTFAKRAEMYYRKRPEIVNFVEEAFRSYRALAERYDHLSRELQSANRTIATAFPEDIPFSLDDEDEENQDKEPKHLHFIAKGSNIPEVPEIPKKDFSGHKHSMLLSRKGQCTLKTMTSSGVVKQSGLTKEEALEEIDKLQKGILVLQTEKEFVRSSYEHSYEKCWDLEDEINEMQKRVCGLQDEFSVGAEIDDSEARTLMANTALNNCKEAIAMLEEKQKQSVEEMKIEKERIEAAKERFEALRRKFDKPEESVVVECKTEEPENLCELGSESVRESNEVDSNENLTVVKLVEKIDELVERVVSLETSTSSNTALVKTLRSETDELQEHICGLEEDKASLVSDSTDMKRRIASLEEELSNVKTIFHRVEEQNKTLQKHFGEANYIAEDLSEKLQGVKMDEEAYPRKDAEELKDDFHVNIAPERSQESKQQGKSDIALSESASTCFGTEQEDSETEDNDVTPNWRELLTDGVEDREKVILDEYTSVLRDYREVKRKLSDVEKKNSDGFYELSMQIRELKNALAYKDVEIQSLRENFDSSEKDYPNPVERNHLDHEGLRESVSISPISNFSNSTTPHQLGGDFKKTPTRTRHGETRIKFAGVDDSPRTMIQTVEEKVRADIDRVLEENLEFWLRFSTSVHQIQKYQTSVQDLKSELSKLRIETRNQQDSSNPRNSNNSVTSEARPIYRHLREIRTELQLWLENSAVLRDELQGRFSSLGNIQDEISRVTSHSGRAKANEAEISGYQAAKFHGEILNMKQENKKVFTELQTGLDRARTLKNDVERVLSNMEENLGFSSANETRMQNKSSSSGRPRIPLRSFLFGVKLKKHKQQRQSPSFFHCVSPSPALHKHNSYDSPQKFHE